MAIKNRSFPKPWRPQSEVAHIVEGLDNNQWFQALSIYLTELNPAPSPSPGRCRQLNFLVTAMQELIAQGQGQQALDCWCNGFNTQVWPGQWAPPVVFKELWEPAHFHPDLANLWARAQDAVTALATKFSAQ